MLFKKEQYQIYGVVGLRYHWALASSDLLLTLELFAAEHEADG